MSLRRLLTRRQVLNGFAGLSASVATVGGYSLVEPFRLRVTRYSISPPDWPAALKVRVAVLADLHACAPWMPPERIQQIVTRTNALSPDVVLLLGDFVVGRQLGVFGQPVPHRVWAGLLAGIKARFGVHAVLGNHDWWEDRAVQEKRAGPVKAGLALKAHGIPVYENDVLRLEKDGYAFWLAGLADQWAFWPRKEDYGSFLRGGKRDYIGLDDLTGTLAKVSDEAPIILMAHEPDIFPDVPERVALTVSGHTHGGQVRFAGFAPVVPSKYGRRYAYGHIIEDGKNLVVSAGLGCSGVPIRFGATPEIVLIELGTGANYA